MKDYELDAFASKPIKYFSHDADAHLDNKCKKLIKRGGWAAYGRWWLLCEVLARADGHMINVCTEEDKDIAADDLQFKNVADLESFIELLRSVELIAQDNDFIYSNRMFENAKKVSAHRAGAAKTNAKRWGKE